MVPPIAKLNPRAYAVVEEARRALLPPVGARERLEALIDVRLSELAPTPVVNTARFRNVIRGPAAPTFALGLVVAAAVLWPRPKPVELSQASVVQAPQISQANAAAPGMSSAPAPSLPAAEPAVSVIPPLEPHPPRRAQDGLGQEVVLLSKATSDLRAGHATEALKSLDEYQRKFPNGVLAVERSALRAQTLCSLKRVGEGRVELARLTPQTPAAGRARQVCDAMAASASDK
jgi:hypothetical protein